jgi:ribose transport system substrate-binding protein
MKRIATGLLAVLIAGTLAVTGCSKKDTPAAGAAPAATKIGVAVPTADHGWTGGIGWWADFAVKELAAKYPQIEFRVVHASNPTEQVGQVENLMTWGMNYLVILPHESAPLTPIVIDAHKQGVYCIVVDRGLAEGTKLGYINLAGDNPGMGRLSGQWLAKTMKGEGLVNYVTQGGLPITIDTERMTNFFAEMDKEASLVNLEGKDKYQFANFSPQDSLKLMEAHLQKYPKIEAVFCQDDDAMMGALQAIKESNRTDIKIVMGGAGSKAVMEMIKAGDPLVRATTLYHPSMIRDGIQYAVDVALGSKSKDFHTKGEPTTVVIPSALIDKSNVDQYYNADSSF